MRIVIIGGGGGIGYALAEALAAPHDVFVVQANPERAERFAQLDVEFLAGSDTDPEVLRRAAVDRGDRVIVSARARA